MTKRVHILVRSSDLAESMSRYLIRRIEESPNIVLQTNTEIVALEGVDHLESVRWKNIAVGDARGGSIKRVASAVGEGSTANSRYTNIRQSNTELYLESKVINC